MGCMENAKTVLSEQLAVLHRLAGILIEKESLNAREIQEITGPGQGALPNPVTV